MNASNENTRLLTLSPPCQHPCRTTRMQGPHLGEFCLECGKWFRWLPQPVTHMPDLVMPFGLHKGTPIKKLPTKYLEWGTENLEGAWRQRFVLALKQRYKDFGRAMRDVTAHEQQNLKKAIEAFSKRFGVDVGQVHRYLALYDSMKPEGSCIIRVDYQRGTISVDPPTSLENQPNH